MKEKKKEFTQMETAALLLSICQYGISKLFKEGNSKSSFFESFQEGPPSIRVT